jgi:hypothetical protein
VQTLLEFKPYLLVIFTSGTKLAGAQQATPASFFPCHPIPTSRPSLIRTKPTRLVGRHCFLLPETLESFTGVLTGREGKWVRLVGWPPYRDAGVLIPSGSLNDTLHPVVPYLLRANTSET